MQKGTLANIIAVCKVKNGVPIDVVVNAETVRNCAKMNILDLNTTAGTISPMAEIEPWIVAIIIQLAAMCLPLTPTQYLEVCNSIITGTSISTDLDTWQQKHCNNY